MASLRMVFREDIDGKIRQSLMLPDGIIRQDAARRARKVRDRARLLANSRSANPTGQLARSIRFTTVTPRGVDSVQAQVGSDLPHAKWTEEGTGIFGPFHTPIVPKSRKFLLFRSRSIASRRPTRNAVQGRLFLVKSVRGQPGKHYLRDSLSAAVD